MHTYYFFIFIKIYCKSYVKIGIFHYRMGSNANLKLNSIISINIKNVKAVHYSWHLDVQFTVVFMTASHSYGANFVPIFIKQI